LDAGTDTTRVAVGAAADSESSNDSMPDASADRAKTEYNAIASAYADNKERPWRVHAERHSMLCSIKALAGSGEFSGLDIACGSGVYTRLLVQAGASRAVGVDISDEMVKEATAATEPTAESSKIEFVCGDASNLADPKSDLSQDIFKHGQYDIVTATYLFNYAPNEEILRKMVKGAFAALRPGGHMVALNNNPFDDNPRLFRDISSQYVRKEGDCSGPLKNGDEISWILLDKPCGSSVGSFTNYWLSADLVERVLAEEGFTSISWKSLSADKGHEELNKYWGTPYKRDAADSTATVSPVVQLFAAKPAE